MYIVQVGERMDTEKNLILQPSSPSVSTSTSSSILLSSSPIIPTEKEATKPLSTYPQLQTSKNIPVDSTLSSLVTSNGTSQSATVSQPVATVSLAQITNSSAVAACVSSGSAAAAATASIVVSTVSVPAKSPPGTVNIQRSIQICRAVVEQSNSRLARGTDKQAPARIQRVQLRQIHTNKVGGG